MTSAYLPYLGAFLIGLSKAGFTAGLGGMATPLLAIAVPARLAIGIILPLLCFSDALIIATYHGKWNWSYLKLPLLGALGGTGLGMLLVNAISDHVLKISIGWFGLLLCLLLIIRNRWRPDHVYHPKAWQALAVGIAAGFASTLAHAAGPIMAIYFLARKMDKLTFVATNGFFFALVNLMKVPPYAMSGIITRATLMQDLRYMPLVPLGVAGGWALNRYIPEKMFTYVIYTLLIATSLELILK